MRNTVNRSVCECSNMDISLFKTEIISESSNNTLVTTPQFVRQIRSAILVLFKKSLVGSTKFLSLLL
jgi:hypothetical protein